MVVWQYVQIWQKTLTNCCDLIAHPKNIFKTKIWKLALTCTPDPKQSASINFVHINNSSPIYRYNYRLLKLMRLAVNYSVNHKQENNNVQVATQMCTVNLSDASSRHLKTIAVFNRLVQSHASYRGLEHVCVTGRFMPSDCGFGTSCLLHWGHLAVSAISENSWKRICLSRTRLPRLVTLVQSHADTIWGSTHAAAVLLTCGIVYQTV